jgi:hypothetical protein
MRSLVASAELLKPLRANVARAENWMEEAWERWDDTPELRSAGGWYGNALSRARLVLATRGAPGDDPTPLPDDHPAQQLLRQLGSQEGQSQLLAEFAPHLLVPGIGYLVGQEQIVNPDGTLSPVSDPGAPTSPTADALTPQAEPQTRTSWMVLSFDELRVQPGADGADRWEIKGDDNKWGPLPPGTLPVKVWRRHARHRRKADSQVRALLGVLRELLFLSSHVEATATSRLAGAGILAIPTEATMPVSRAAAATEDPFLAELMDTMLTPIEDRSAPSAVVPILLRVPGEFLEKVQHIKFDRTFDEIAVTLREEARRRFAAGMDMPPEVLIGLGDVNHWTAWQIDESALKLHLIPMLQAICEGLTIGWLHPALAAAREAGGGSDAGVDGEIICWFDVSNLQVRPDRSGDAKELYQMAAIGLDALLRETGFDEADRPDPEAVLEQRLWGLLQNAPSLAPLLLPLLGVDLPAGAAAEAVGQGPGPGVAPVVEESAPGNEPPDTQDNPPPAPDAIAAAAVLAAADAFVTRALERVGGRLTNARRTTLPAVAATAPPETLHTHIQVSADQLDRLLAGAWRMVPDVAARYGVNSEALTATLDTYTRGRLVAGIPHSFDELAAAFA